MQGFLFISALPKVKRGAGVIAIGTLAMITAAQVGAEITNSEADLKNTGGSGQREGFVRALLEKTRMATNRKCNIMIFNMSNDYKADLVGYKMFEKIEFHGFTYGIFLFESGIFTNKGNGGWSNWGFYGVFVRSGESGKVLTFEHTDCPIVKKNV